MAAKSRGDFRPTKLQSFEFKVFQRLKKLEGIEGAKILIACSGGMDSVVLLESLVRIAPKLRLKLSCSYVHHGPSRDAFILKARASAGRLVARLCKQHAISLHAEKFPHGQLELRSEKDLREYRHAVLQNIARGEGCDYIAFAHHADDLLETRLIRLIRGTGPQGLEAMKERRGQFLRPLLSFEREDLRQYAEERALTWLEDPSNRSNEPLRNWLRNSWLPALDAKRPGSVASLARSLALLAEGHSKSIKSPEFSRLGIAERKAELARLMRESGAQNFTARHVAEVLKRLESRRSHRFTMLNLHWEINAGQVLVNSASEIASEKRREKVIAKKLNEIRRKN